MCIFLSCRLSFSAGHKLFGRAQNINKNDNLFNSQRTQSPPDKHTLNYCVSRASLSPKQILALMHQVLPLAKSKGSFSGRIPRAGASVTNTFHLQVTKTQEFRSTQPFLSDINFFEYSVQLIIRLNFAKNG